MNQKTEKIAPLWVAGFMSGTSIDAVDAAMILTDGVEVYEFGPVAERKYTASERVVLQDAVAQARDWNWHGPVPDYSAACAALNIAHIEAWDKLLREGAGPRPALAGVHGQTVLHRAPQNGQLGETRQILDALALQARLGIPLAYDFRTPDMRAGGQGAPLAPAYHRALLHKSGFENSAIVNLGGVSNITFLGKEGRLYAFDTGPANGPIDEWVEAHGLGSYDRGGALASRGRVHEGLLVQLLDAPYFDQKPPKSLDRYDFNANLVRGLSPADGAATLVALCAHSLARSLEHAPRQPDQLILCGGGRHNPALVRAIEEALPCSVILAEEAAWRGDSLEAEAFAYLAMRSVRGLSLSFPETTGARGEIAPAPILGRFPPK